MKLKHWYHIYADGHWQIPLTYHIHCLRDSGLMEALDEINVGIVGCDANRQAVKEVLPPEFNVVVEACTGYEQVTMETIGSEEPAYILYAHTKGASNPNILRKIWRESMTNGTVYGWQVCVELMDKGYDAVGCYWQPAPSLHFSGTFWWATSDYIDTLPPVDHFTRFDAEMWIGRGKRGGKFGDLCPGFISHNNIIRKPNVMNVPSQPPGYVTFMPLTRIAGYVKGRIYSVRNSTFIENAINKGHFQLLNRDAETVKTIIINR